MKHEWKKEEKEWYLPKDRPGVVVLPRFGFFVVSGEGNPNGAAFSEYIGVLYSLSYAVKMSPKGGYAPSDYFDYSIYPLEGVWNLTEEGRKRYEGKINKDDLVFDLMIRQPRFVTPDFAGEAIERTKSKKPHPLLDRVRFEYFAEGSCVQMLHRGSYDDEPASFAAMEAFASENNLKRKSMTHREIYLSDARKTEAEKLKTVLRFRVE